jgi:hypothetical protein
MTNLSVYIMSSGEMRRKVSVGCDGVRGQVQEFRQDY